MVSKDAAKDVNFEGIKNLEETCVPQSSPLSSQRHAEDQHTDYGRHSKGGLLVPFQQWDNKGEDYKWWAYFLKLTLFRKHFKITSSCLPGTGLG